MNIAAIKNLDIANGLGIRVSVFVSGCRNFCKGCFNSPAADFNYGTPFNAETLYHIMTLLGQDEITGLSILGGEPLDPFNQKGVYAIVDAAKERYPNKTIWLYTGYTYEELIVDKTKAQTPYLLPILQACDVLVDGRFDEELKNPSLAFRGSSNQRIINLPDTLRENHIVLSMLMETTTAP